MKQWIWEQNDYPNFTYDLNRLEPLLQKVSLEQGYLAALTQTMHSDNIFYRQIEALENEAMSTSAIEGEILNRESVKASIQKKLGFQETAYKNFDSATDYLVEVLIDANTNYDKPLTLERLYAWHGALFPQGYKGFGTINIAQLRGDTPMQVVGGYGGKATVFYEAPPRESLEAELQHYLHWFNDTEASLLKACIAHLWFVIIHPFDDGNGRITRAITDRVLSKIEHSKISRLYSMSSAINSDRKGYYKVLERTTGYVKREENHLDVTLWCEWFLSILYSELIQTKEKLDYIIQKTQFWDRHKESDLNARQIKVLNKILDMGIENFEGDLSKKKYMKIADTTSATASRDMAMLLRLGCIKQVDGTSGRNIRYRVIL